MSLLNWFIAQVKGDDHPMVVEGALPVVRINGAPTGVEWERITENMTEEEAEQLRAELLFADRDGPFYPGWGGEGYGGAGYDPSID